MNFNMVSPDNITFGAWLILSDPFYQSYRTSTQSNASQPSLEVVQEALRTYPTILYCHGAAATRAAPTRVRLYSTATSRLKANVLALDYRGFGDSEGVPSTEGLVEDAKTAWRWLMEQGARPEDVLLMGHSLGTGVTSGLSTALAKEGIKPRGVTLLAPFTTLSTLLETYSIRGIPILQPLQTFPIGRSEC